MHNSKTLLYVKLVSVIFWR